MDLIRYKTIKTKPKFTLRINPRLKWDGLNTSFWSIRVQIDSDRKLGLDSLRLMFGTKTKSIELIRIKAWFLFINIDALDWIGMMRIGNLSSIYSDWCLGLNRNDWGGFGLKPWSVLIYIDASDWAGIIYIKNLTLLHSNWCLVMNRINNLVLIHLYWCLGLNRN